MPSSVNPQPHKVFGARSRQHHSLSTVLGDLDGQVLRGLAGAEVHELGQRAMGEFHGGQASDFAGTALVGVVVRGGACASRRRQSIETSTSVLTNSGAA